MYKKLAKKSISIAFGFLSFVFFFKKDIIIFSQTKSRYSGNSKYLFEYLVRNDFHSYWLYTDKIQKEKIPAEFASNLIRRKSIKALYISLISNYFVISHGGGDLGFYWYIAKNNNVLNLWHAIGIKKTGLIDNNFNNKKDFEQHIKETRNYSFMTVSSDIDRYVTASSHNIDIKKVFVTGNPRTDYYFEKMQCRTKDEEFKVLYAPTFRDYELNSDIFFPFLDFSFEKLSLFFLNYPYLKIYLRPHPNDVKSIKQAVQLQEKLPKNVLHFSSQVCDDIDEYMFQFDLIITDYSSIYIEPLLADIPCIFIPFDYDYYLKTRGLAYNYDSITPGPIVSNFTELVNSMVSALKGAPEWADKRKIVKDMFFTYQDDQACNRIVQQVLQLKSNSFTKKKKKKKI